MSPPRHRALRGRIVRFEDDPSVHGPAAVVDHPDGLLLIADGQVTACGDVKDVAPSMRSGTRVDHHPGCLILPGLIDLHVHYPQTQVIASYGAQLLEWLERYTFVEEQRFADPHHCRAIASFFLDELLRHGTTTASVFTTVHPLATEVFFEEAERRQLRMIAGKVMMDRNAPDRLLDDAESSYQDSKALLQRWHGRGRLGYAISPRFALTSTPAQLEAAGALAAEHPDAWVQTHLAEHPDEIRLVAGLFPEATSYTDVYDQAGLLGPKTLLGHCLHLEDEEVERIAASGARAVFCPTSNLFIGSGLFDHARLKAGGVAIGLATDVGGGTSYSMLRTAAEGYKVLQLQGQNLDAFAAFYLMTLGNARALRLDHRIGSLAPGTEADVVVFDPRATPAMAHRMERIDGARGGAAGAPADLAEMLFVLMTMGDERCVRSTYVMGEPAFVR